MIADESVVIEPLTASFRPWTEWVLTEFWGAPRVVTRGRLHHAESLPGFIARLGGEPVGLVTYRIEADECEIVTLNSLHEGIGVGTALTRAVLGAARAAGSRRVWLITTNDNLPALGFYQRQGFTLRAVYPGAIAESRRLKPDIPERGWRDLPIRDEIELERLLHSPANA
ncbi:MAG: GNAT family N-acetyltransferase [bacterium]|nr:GNAT family N-acetyltransferase [bacterium]